MPNSLSGPNPMALWTRNIKIAEIHALFYYSLKSTLGMIKGNGGQANTCPLTGSHQRCLCLKILAGEMVNVRDEEVQEIILFFCNASIRGSQDSTVGPADIHDRKGTEHMRIYFRRRELLLFSFLFLNNNGV